MANRAEQKAKARAERLERERKLAEEARRKQRLMRLGGVGIVAVIVIVAAIAISSGGGGKTPPTPTSAKASATVARVNALLSGIPQSGNTLGNPNAQVQVTEYGDLECSICDELALPTNVSASNGSPGSGIEDQLIDDYVRTGKASLVYRSYDTATSGGATPGMFGTQQAAALAAGLQNKAWYYIELFYNEQQPEGTDYVTQAFLGSIARQISGLNYSKWLSDLNGNSSLTSQVTSDNDSAHQLGYSGTPTLVIKGPKGEAQPLTGIPQWSQVQAELKAVS